MTIRPTGGLGLVRSDFGGRPRWAFVGSDALHRVQTDCIKTAELEAIPVDRQELRDLVENVMGVLERYSSSLASHRMVPAGCMCSTFPFGAS
ncbi:hypothetical protein ACIP98_41810 [Streptomyces sp. NPDC088354]|uniref:hypothetical protein n=1 Tax=Streptomyces sp. NPDC088354 TaxID=3365856 RepID=UPI0038112E32